MAGGEGSRLKPYTLNKPKAMIKFKGKRNNFSYNKKYKKPNRIKFCINETQSKSD